MVTTLDNKNEYAKSICLFLAELLRTRRITLARSSEIAQKVLQNINLIDTEEDFLRLTKELAFEFEELHYFKERLSKNVHVNQRRELEKKVREFAASVMYQDSKLALDVLAAAVSDEARLEDLGARFPQFEQFIKTK
jgi:hypothetical protein